MLIKRGLPQPMVQTLPSTSLYRKGALPNQFLEAIRLSQSLWMVKKVATKATTFQEDSYHQVKKVTHFSLHKQDTKAVSTNSRSKRANKVDSQAPAKMDSQMVSNSTRGDNQARTDTNLGWTLRTKATFSRDTSSNKP